MTGAYKFIYTKFKWAVKLIYRLKFVGTENEPQEGALLVCSNHISAADPFLVSAATRNQISYMAKKELFKVPLVNKLVTALGAYPVDRKGADAGAVKKTIKMLEEGRCIGIFPQGHRQRGVDPRETEVKNGAALIAVKANATVLPCFVKTKKRRWTPFCRVDVYIGEPIKPEELAYDPGAPGEYRRISEYVFDKICQIGESADEQ